MSRPDDVRYFIFDVESVSNGELISNVRYPGENLGGQHATMRYRAELLESRGSDFIPYTYQMPISVVIAKVKSDLTLADLVALDQPQFRPHVITDLFWRGWEAYRFPTFVSFNGRSFDMPLMELAAFQFGLTSQPWFHSKGRSFEQPRNRYNTEAHLDLQDLLVNYGASRFNGGLNLAATLLGKPGKIHVQGHMVQDMYDEGRLAEINDYCRCDVLDTYFVFLRTRVMLGDITIDREQEIVAQTKEWLLERADQSEAYATYLDHWSDWPNPWKLDGAAAANSGSSDPAHSDPADSDPAHSDSLAADGAGDETAIANPDSQPTT